MTSVSVFVPCYGYAHVLRDCVNSVLEQPGVDVRVLIIDDASPDDTADVAAELQRQDSRVEYLRHSENQGHIATYNDGIDWATGDYTVLLSADDMLTPGSLLRVTRVLDTHPEASFGHGRALVWRQGQPRPAPSTIEEECPFEVVPGRTWIERMCRKGDNVVYSPEVITRTSVQKQVGGYRAELPHTGDMEMWLRLAACGDVVVVDAHQAIYRVHGENMHVAYTQATSDLQHRRRAFLDVFDEYEDQLDHVDRLRHLARRGVVTEEIKRAIRSIDRGEGRSEAAGRLRGALRAEPLHAVTTRAFYSCVLRLALGPALFQRCRAAARSVLRRGRRLVRG